MLIIHYCNIWIDLAVGLDWCQVIQFSNELFIFKIMIRFIQIGDVILKFKKYMKHVSTTILFGINISGFVVFSSLTCVVC